jgi:hypothetical protein
MTGAGSRYPFPADCYPVLGPGLGGESSGADRVQVEGQAQHILLILTLSKGGFAATILSLAKQAAERLLD